MPKKSTPAVSSKAYRHFAAATLVVTLLVGLFASGENRQAVAQAIENQREAAEAAQFKDEKYGKPKLVTTKLKARVYTSERDYRDIENDYGAASDRVGSRVQNMGGRSYSGAINRAGGQYVPASYAKRQISEEELAQLTPAQREALLAQIANGGLPTDPTEKQRQINNLISASARRSGNEVGVE